MIKVSVMYPYTAGARFDHAYYRERHMPMMKQRLGAACLYYTVDKGIAALCALSAAERRRAFEIWPLWSRLLFRLAV